MEQSKTVIVDVDKSEIKKLYEDIDELNKMLDRAENIIEKLNQRKNEIHIPIMIGKKKEDEIVLNEKEMVENSEYSRILDLLKSGQFNFNSVNIKWSMLSEKERHSILEIFLYNDIFQAHKDQDYQSLPGLYNALIKINSI